MIILLGSVEDDYFVSITEWLNHFKVNFKHVDFDNFSVDNFNILFKDGSLSISLKNGDFTCSFDHVSTFFYRSGKILIKDLNKISAPFNLSVANSYYHLEQESLIDFLYDEIKKKSFGYLARNPMNKLKQLKAAQEAGLQVPETLITSSKRMVTDLFQTNGVINKAIQENIFIEHGENIYVQRVEKMETGALRSNYSSSLFQTSIDKVIEIRSFFLFNKFYSIGFYSSNDNVDMRDSYFSQNHFKINLPEKVEYQLLKLMKKLELLSGSIDLILSNNGEYYFLEVNTEGQYDWVSKLGGYNLDLLLSEYLICRENEFINKRHETN